MDQIETLRGGDIDEARGYYYQQQRKEIDMEKRIITLERKY